MKKTYEIGDRVIAEIKGEITEIKKSCGGDGIRYVIEDDDNAIAFIYKEHIIRGESDGITNKEIFGRG